MCDQRPWRDLRWCLSYTPRSTKSQGWALTLPGRQQASRKELATQGEERLPWKADWAALVQSS